MNLPVALRDEVQTEFDEAFDHYEAWKPELGVDFAAPAGLNQKEFHVMEGEFLPTSGFGLLLFLIISVIGEITPFGCLGAVYCVIVSMNRNARCDRMALYLCSLSFTVNLVSFVNCLLIKHMNSNSQNYWLWLSALALVVSGVAVGCCARSQLSRPG